MAPRKTTKTAAEPQPNPETVEALKEAEQGGLAAFETVNALMGELNQEQRFQVALAILPVIVRHGADQHLEGRLYDDENEAGACARIAFEYADAFIAQSKKGQGDGIDH